jgi:hypothetical protein
MCSGIGDLPIGGNAGVRIRTDEAAVLAGQLELSERLPTCGQVLEEAGLPVGDLSTCHQQAVVGVEVEIVEDGAASIDPALTAVRVLGYVDDALGVHLRSG